MIDDLFFNDDSQENKETPKKNSQNKEKYKAETKSEVEIYNELEEKAFKKGNRKSIFYIVESDILTNISNMIHRKQMSYNVALKKLKELYPNEEKIQDIKTSNSLRYFLISKGYIDNEKALETINNSISKSGFAKTKRQKIIKDVIEDLVENYSEDLINNEKFQNALLNNETFISKLKDKLS